jgi:hypothetical protein
LAQHDRKIPLVGSMILGEPSSLQAYYSESILSTPEMNAAQCARSESALTAALRKQRGGLKWLADAESAFDQ